MSQPGREAEPTVRTRSSARSRDRLREAVQSSLLSHAARAKIRPARFVRMRTFAIAKV